MPANLQKVKKTEPVTTAKEQPAVEFGLELEPELEPELSVLELEVELEESSSSSEVVLAESTRSLLLLGSLSAT